MSDGLQKLIAEIDVLEERYSFPGFGEKLALLCAAICTLGIIPMHAKKDPQRLRTVRAPDHILAAIAKAPEASQQGLDILAAGLKKRGFATMEEVVFWAYSERKRTNTPKAPAAATPAFTPEPPIGRGAQALLDRVSSRAK